MSDDEDLFGRSPLLVLRQKALQVLSNSLNGRKVLKTPDGQLRDWTGLADFAGLSHDERLSVETAVDSDHTRRIILLWCRKDNVTVQSLVDGLKLMDRFDVIHDARDFMVADCMAVADAESLPVRTVVDSRALTVQDVQALAAGQPLVTYDAMVLFGESLEDEEFSHHFVDRCEQSGLRIFVPQRDLIAGTMEHETSSKIIEERCKKVVAIFSPSFLECEKNMFLTSFAQYVSIVGGSNSKIIPIILRGCKLPAIINMYHKVVYDPRRTYVNFWDKILRVTFGVQNLPESLKKYSYFLDDQNAAQKPDQAAVEPSIDPVKPIETPSIVSGNSKYATDTVMTTVTEPSVGKLVDLSPSVDMSDIVVNLPTPPASDPTTSQELSDQVKSKSRLKKLKERLLKKKRAEVH